MCRHHEAKWAAGREARRVADVAEEPRSSRWADVVQLEQRAVGGLHKLAQLLRRCLHSLVDPVELDD
jgi:hypothetical protein